ncbi:MAG: TetR/AcrR family transcriptional regulator [Acidimicrobiales bacterium]
MNCQRRSQGERRSETRASLVRAAAAQFAERGFDAVSVDEVAAAAGRTSGAVYDHFGSKHGLLMAVLDQWAQSLVALLASDFESQLTLHARLESLAHRVIVAPDASTRQLLLLEQELMLRAARDAVLRGALYERVRHAQDRLAKGLQQWVELGMVPADAPPPEVMAASLRAMVVGMSAQQRLDPTSFDVISATALLRSAISLSPALVH